MTAATPEDAQVSLDRFWSTTGDARLRPPGRYAEPGTLVDGVRPVWPTVGELAEREALMVLPVVPFPATIEELHRVDDRASVAFRGNRYSVNPGLGGSELTLRHRLGTTTLEIFSPAGLLMVAHRLAPPGAGMVVRSVEHKAALEKAVLSQFTSARPCDLAALADIVALAFPDSTDVTGGQVGA